MMNQYQASLSITCHREALFSDNIHRYALLVIDVYSLAMDHH